MGHQTYSKYNYLSQPIFVMALLTDNVSHVVLTQSPHAFHVKF